MRILYQFLIIGLLAILVGDVLVSCNKPNEIELPTEGTIYMPQAVGTRSKISLKLAAKPQEIVFGAAYGGLNYSKTDNTVTFQVNNSLINAYNAKNGTSYIPLPASGYTIPSLSSIIKAGTVSSEPLIVSVQSNTLAPNGKYILPITITGISAGSIDSALKTTYFTIDTILRISVDVTAQGTLSVSNENSGGATAGEGSPKVVDNDVNTKYLYSGFNPLSWMQLRFAAPVAVGAYTLTSADDAPTRDPKDWELKGSNDGTNWTTIDSRTNIIFLNRKQTSRFEIAGTPQAYTYYRIYITANGGSTIFQLAEWRLIRYE